MTEPTPTEPSVLDAINEWISDIALTSRDSFIEVVGIDPDLPLSQLRADLEIADRVRQCEACTIQGEQWVAIDLHPDEGHSDAVLSAVGLLAWLREGSNQ